MDVNDAIILFAKLNDSRSEQMLKTCLIFRALLTTSLTFEF